MLAPRAARNAASAPLVIDSTAPEAARFRSTTESRALPAGIDGRGFAALRCSGSAQFSAAGFADIQARLGHPDPAGLYVVDLREEAHGFLNGAAVSWYAERNWSEAAGSDAETALAIEARRLARLAERPVAQVADAGRVKRGEPTATAEWEWAVASVASEREALGLPEGRYLRLPVTDHVRPRDEVVERFVAFARSLPAGAHVHLHCRGGKGRTATFLLLYDMLRNAAVVSAAAMFARHAALLTVDLSRRPDASSWKAPYALERLAFLERFHGYAAENPGGSPETWREWLEKAPR